MEHAGLMGRLHRPGERVHQVCNLFVGQRLPADHLRQRFSRDVFQHQERPVVVKVEIEDAGQDRFIDGGQNPPLAQNRPAGFVAGAQRGPRRLENHPAAEGRMERAVHLRLTAGADAAQERIPPDPFGTGGRGRFLRGSGVVAGRAGRLGLRGTRGRIASAEPLQRRTFLAESLQTLAAEGAPGEMAGRRRTQGTVVQSPPQGRILRTGEC